MNTKLLKRVAAAILKHPDQFEMSCWFSPTLELHKGDTVVTAGGCGTAACIAGWALSVSLGHSTVKQTNESVRVDPSEPAAALLQLDRKQAKRLFLLDDWPPSLAEAYDQADSKLRASIAARRINRFIKTKGAE